VARIDARAIVTQAVIFDVDGTLLDTKEFILRSFEHVFQALGLPCPSRNDISVVMGQPLEECYRAFASQLDAALLCKRHRSFQEDNLSLVVPFENTARTLVTLREHGIKLAAVTTRKQTGRQSLRYAGIEDMLSSVVTGDDVEHFKPHPEGVHKALGELNVPAIQAIMVGDLAVDIQAGKRAGTATAAALYGFSTKESLAASQPDYMLADIAELLTVLGLESPDLSSYTDR
jgi:pyrophosphatase PpaX